MSRRTEFLADVALSAFAHEGLRFDSYERERAARIAWEAAGELLKRAPREVLAEWDRFDAEDAASEARAIAKDEAMQRSIAEMVRSGVKLSERHDVGPLYPIPPDLSGEPPVVLTPTWAAEAQREAALDRAIDDKARRDAADAKRPD